MGEAKRRKKLLGDKYGKSAINPLIEFKQIPVNELEKPTSLLPDFGHTYINQFGATPMTVEVQNPFTFYSTKEGYIGFEGFDNSLGTIITSVATAKKIGNATFVATIKPSLEEKYKTKTTNEWVIPFRFVNESEIKILSE